MFIVEGCPHFSGGLEQKVSHQGWPSRDVERLSMEDPLFSWWFQYCTKKCEHHCAWERPHTHTHSSASFNDTSYHCAWERAYTALLLSVT